jgi:hypothetical protein
MIVPIRVAQSIKHGPGYLIPFRLIGGVGDGAWVMVPSPTVSPYLPIKTVLLRCSESIWRQSPMDEGLTVLPDGYRRDEDHLIVLSYDATVISVMGEVVMGVAFSPSTSFRLRSSVSSLYATSIEAMDPDDFHHGSRSVDGTGL